MTTSTIAELQRRVGEINVANGWRSRPEEQRTGDDDVHAKIARLALITTEVAEAIEEVRNGHAVDETYYGYPPVPASLAAEFASGEAARQHWESKQQGKPEGVPSELADIVIRALDAADAWGIDLAVAIEEKLVYNSTRGFRHGGKRA